MQGPSGDAPSVRFGEKSEVQLKVRLAIQGIGTACQPSVVGKLINQAGEYTLPWKVGLGPFHRPGSKDSTILTLLSVSLTVTWQRLNH